MSNPVISRDGIHAWVQQTEEGQKNFRNAYGMFSVEEFFADEDYVSKSLALVAFKLQYPGDGNWSGLLPTTQADIQISEMARIIRKLLPHVPDDFAFKAKVQDYLVRKGLAGKVLRDNKDGCNAQE